MAEEVAREQQDVPIACPSRCLRVFVHLIPRAGPFRRHSIAKLPADTTARTGGPGPRQAATLSRPSASPGSRACTARLPAGPDARLNFDYTPCYATAPPPPPLSLRPPAAEFT